MALYFHNHFGDFPNKVIVCESEYRKELRKATAHIRNIDERIDSSFFDVHTKAYLSKYDTTETPIYAFKPGHYEVELYETLTFLIRWHPQLPKHKPYDDPENLTALPQVNLTHNQN